MAHWSIAGAIAKLRSDVNTLTWLVAELRWMLGRYGHYLKVDSGSYPAPESASADTELTTQGPLDHRGEGEGRRGAGGHRRHKESQAKDN